MTASTSSVSPLRQRMLDDMRMRKLSPKTQIGYIRSVRQFAAYLKRSPDTATAEELRSYQLHMIDHGTSAVSINDTLSGLQFLFEHTLDHPELMRKMQSVPVPHKLPVVLSRDEVSRLLAAVGNLKHQTALSVAYGAGLRVSEVCALKVSDIDSQRMALRIEQGKGSKDRYAMLSPVLLEQLRNWWRYATCTRQDARRWVVVPRTGPHRSAQHPPTQSRHSCRRGCGAYRQACFDAYLAPQLCHPPAGTEGGHPRDPGTARAQANWRPPRSMPRWPPTCCAR